MHDDGAGGGERIVMIGAGHAAGQCVASLRQKGWSGEIVVVGEEPFPPYQRPPLSKAYLSGDVARERLFVRPQAFYEKENVTLKLGARATAVDRIAKCIVLDNGETLDYSRLIFATGSRVRRFDGPGGDLAGIHYVRMIDDIDRLREAFSPGKRLCVVGAGYIGLETAAVAAKAGLDVTVLEREDRVLSRVAGARISKFFKTLHENHGVKIQCSVGVDAFEGDNALSVVRLSSGETLSADIAVIGIGILPNEELARDAGLAVDSGIVVDRHTCTDDPFIYAIGDCTRHPSNYASAMIRLESVHNALEQAKTAAGAICGAPAAYDQAPWFWSDQYDVKLQTVGICGTGYDEEIMRGDENASSFSVFYRRGGTLVAVDSVNAPADHMISRRLLASGVNPSAAALADGSQALKALL